MYKPVPPPTVYLLDFGNNNVFCFENFLKKIAANVGRKLYGVL